MLQVKKYNSIKEIDQGHWDSIINTNDYFHTHQFISVVEESRVENATFQYLLIYDDSNLVATTVLSGFNISLDLFISTNFVVRKIRQLFPNVFTIKILVCGLPASFGQLNVVIKDALYAEEVCTLIASGMKQLANETGTRFLAIKELRQGELIEFSSFEKNGFFQGNSIPYMNLPIRWKTFNDYLSSLRHPYRRRIMLSLKKSGAPIPRIIPREAYNENSKNAALVLGEPEMGYSEKFYKMYLGVMSRTPTKLETLNKAFFENLFGETTGIKILSLVVAGKEISSGILVLQGETITFMLAGRENEKDDYDSYFNLVYGIIAYAIESGCKYLKLGQTAYWVKQSIGALPENEYLYFASTSKFWQAIIRKFRNVFFPPTVLKNIHAFKTNNNDGVVLNAKTDLQQLTLA
jgi:predicted N-acyltransferase